MIQSVTKFMISSLGDVLPGVMDHGDVLRYNYHEDHFFNRVISVISVVLKETTLTISVSTGVPVSITRHNLADTVPTSNRVCIKKVAIITTFYRWNNLLHLLLSF